MSRNQLSRDDMFAEMSPEVGELDSDAVAALMEDDADHALGLLAEMAGATDRKLAALAAQIAGRLVLEVSRSGRASGRGIGRISRGPAARFDGDLDLDASMDQLVDGRAAGRRPSLDDLTVKHWRRPDTAICVVLDRSGSMEGPQLATAAIAAAACTHRAPTDFSVLAFSDKVLALASQNDARPRLAVVQDVLRLRGHGTTNLDAAMKAAADQLARSSARRRVVVLLSDCRWTAGPNPVATARGLDDLCIVAPANDADDARWFAEATGARLATATGPHQVAIAVNEVIDR